MERFGCGALRWSEKSCSGGWSSMPPSSPALSRARLDEWRVLLDRRESQRRARAWRQPLSHRFYRNWPQAFPWLRTGLGLAFPLSSGHLPLPREFGFAGPSVWPLFAALPPFGFANAGEAAAIRSVDKTTGTRI